MSFNIDDLTSDELDFYNLKNENTKREILKHLNDGKSFSDAVVTEASESLVSYYNWIKDNVKDTDKYKITDFENRHRTDYNGDNLTLYEKELFDTLPNIGKWQIGNYSKMWRGLEEADECLMEFTHNELDYLNYHSHS